MPSLMRHDLIKGTFYEFLHAPEQNVDRASENVDEWSASVKFTATNAPTESGGAFSSNDPSARLVLGDSPKEALQYVVEFDEREEVGAPGPSVEGQ